MRRVSRDFKEIDVQLKLRFWNQNYVGTHYGGSLYSMTDPFYMLMLIENLGKEYIVWDKAASIRFKKPGKGTVVSRFRLSDSRLNEIVENLKTTEKMEVTFHAEIEDEDGDVVALVEKLISIRKKTS